MKVWLHLDSYVEVAINKQVIDRGDSPLALVINLGERSGITAAQEQREALQMLKLHVKHNEPLRIIE